MNFPHCDVNDLDGLLWTHVALLSLTAILVVASFHSQFKDAAPYGRHADPVKAKAWGFPIPQRVGHFISDALPGIPFCLMVYLVYSALLPADGQRYSKVRVINVVLLCGWLLHYAYRGIITPLIMPYSSRTVSVGITAAGIFPNCLFAYLMAAQLACTVYPDNWASQPRFIIGVALYTVGTAINRWADLKLRSGRLAMQRRHATARALAAAAGEGAGAGAVAAVGAMAAEERLASGGGSGACDGGGAGPGASGAMRESLLGPSDGGGGGDGSGSGSGSGKGAVAAGDSGDLERERPESMAAQARVQDRYFVPHGGLYEYVSCPNYLGELIEWTGYALAVWSWPALAWVLFCASTFVPRSLVHHRWYKQQFPDYPPGRKALVPFVL